MRAIRPAFCAAAITILLGPAALARADFSDWQRRLFRGLEFAGGRNFISNPQNGPFQEDNIFAQRLEQNRTGRGYTYEQYRFFGDDTFGNPNSLDLGVFKVQLGRDTAVNVNGQPVGIHTRLGYTTTGIPEVFVSQRTVQRNNNPFGGINNVAPSSLRYRLSFNTGVQDFAVNGNVFISTNGRINALGFYDLDMQVTNNGTYTADGVFLTDERPLDFDIGPVNLSGHIGMDLLAGFIQNLGRPVDALGPRVLSGAAQKDKTLDELLAKIEAGEMLSDDEVAQLVRQALIASVLNDPLGTLSNGLPSLGTGHDGLSLTFRPDESLLGDAPADAAGGFVPEPGTLGLLALALCLSGLPARLARRR